MKKILLICLLISSVFANFKIDKLPKSYNKYDTELKTKDIKDIVNIGVAFYGKKAKVKYKNNKY